MVYIGPPVDQIHRFAGDDRNIPIYLVDPPLVVSCNDEMGKVGHTSWGHEALTVDENMRSDSRTIWARPGGYELEQDITVEVRFEPSCWRRSS